MNRTALAVTAVAFAVGVALDVATGAKNFPGYSATIGLVGCIVIVVVSKWFGTLLSRPEDLYPGEEPADAQEDLRG
jgi:quinol-cytochrome oxidoreductase complex cytochrome b subunit